jgi:hypothetical protein
LAKAQVFSLDIVIAMGIFILILVSTALIWQYSRGKITIEETRNDMETIARNALSVLAETKGNPTNWTGYAFNTTSIKSLGIAEEFLVLDSEKISSLSSENYSAAKTILGILGPNYEFGITIKVWNGSSYAADYTIGSYPNATAYEIIHLERHVLFNSTWAKASIDLWKSCRHVTC